MITIKIKNLFINKSVVEAGDVLYKIMVNEHSRNDIIIIDLEYVEFFSSSFLNPSIGRFIEEFGLDTLKNKFVFNNITKKQIEFFNKYIKNFAN